MSAAPFRILCLDRDPLVAETVALVLRHFQLDVVSLAANGGDQAIPPPFWNVLVIDPWRLKWLDTTLLTKETPLIILASSPVDFYAYRFLKIRAVLSNPFDLDLLVMVLRELKREHLAKTSA